jgi:protein-L-isoaspartate(D-aspartate) O-methyltransferase
LKVSLQVRGEDLHAGRDPEDQPMLAIVFYDERRATLGQGTVGPWRGSFAWRQQTAVIPVPAKAREAIVRIGLVGATGKLWVDGLHIERYEPHR